MTPQCRLVVLEKALMKHLAPSQHSDRLEAGETLKLVVRFPRWPDAARSLDATAGCLLFGSSVEQLLAGGAGHDE